MQTRSDFARPLGLAALSSGVVSVAIAALGILGIQSGADYHLSSAAGYGVQSLIVLNALLTLGGLLGLHSVQAAIRGYGRLGKAGFFVASSGTTVILVANLATLATGEDPLGFLHAIGFLTFFPGVVLLAAGTFRAAVLPRWSSVLLGISPPVLFAGEYGQFAYGLVWITIGYLLMSSVQSGRRAATEQTGI
jgi:hypothetical protein